MDKIRTGIYVSGDVLAECDDYCTKQDISRSELIEQALKLFRQELSIPRVMFLCRSLRSALLRQAMKA